MLKIEPHLGDLSYVEGTYPTPQGIVKIIVTKSRSGKLNIIVKAPKAIKKF